MAQNNNTGKGYLDMELLRFTTAGSVDLKVSKPLSYDIYKNNRTTGSLIFISEGTNETVGAGMIVE